jgi:glycine/D-amino acid oxidase-like deaminating enzyme
MQDLDEATMRILRRKDLRVHAYSSLADRVLDDLPDTIVDLFHRIDSEHHLSSDDLGERLRGTEGRRFDFVGAGISGMMSAYVAGELSRLYNLDWDIHVWEKEKAAGRCSTADSAARIRTTMFGSADEVAGNLATSLFFEHFGHFLGKGYTAVGKVAGAEPNSGLYRSGYLWLFTKQRDLERVKANRELLSRFKIPAFPLTHTQVKEIMHGLNGRKFKFGYLGPTDAFVDPTSIVAGLESYCKHVLGVDFHFGEPVSSTVVTSGQPIRFVTPSGIHETHGLGLTTGAYSPRFLQTLFLNGVPFTGQLPIDVRFRLLVRVIKHGGFSPEVLNELDLFTIYSGKGAYFARESPGAAEVMFGYARKKDPKVALQDVFRDQVPDDNYFFEKMLIEAGLYRLHEALDFDSGQVGVKFSTGNFYGETVDGNYVIGLMKQLMDAHPDGVIGVNAAHNGHGIMASLSSALLLVYRLAGVQQKESPLYDPGRTMNGHGGTVML